MCLGGVIHKRRKIYKWQSIKCGQKQKQLYGIFEVIPIIGWWVKEEACPHFFLKIQPVLDLKFLKGTLFFQWRNSWYQTFVPADKTVTWCHNKSPHCTWCLDRKEHLKLIIFFLLSLGLYQELHLDTWTLIKHRFHTKGYIGHNIVAYCKQRNQFI